VEGVRGARHEQPNRCCGCYCVGGFRNDSVLLLMLLLPLPLPTPPPPQPPLLLLLLLLAVLKRADALVPLSA
jgi:hypothetical protein